MVDGLHGNTHNKMKFDKTILIVGFGSIGRRHTNNILKITNSKIVIFTQRTNISTKEFYNYNSNKKRILINPDFNSCIKESPSVAFITNETSFHTKYAIKLAQMKIDLFIEKPLSNSMKKIPYLKSIIKKHKLQVMIGCNFRFYPPIQKIKHLVEKKITGKIISVQSENSSYLPDWHPDEDYSKGYAARKDLGGGVTLTQIHELDYLVWIFGKITNSKSFIGKFSDLNVTSDDQCSSILKLKNGIIAELHLDYFSKPYYKRLKIRGTKGTLYWNSDENKIKFFNIKRNKWNLVSIKNNYSLMSKNVNQMYVEQLRYFLKCVTERNTPKNNIDEASNILSMALQLKK